MSNDYSNFELTINPDKKRFEIQVENQTAFIEFILNNENIIFLTHTEVPKSIERKGVGSEIVEKTLNYIKDHQYTLAPLCPFVAKYLLKHPEWQSVLAKGYTIK